MFYFKHSIVRNLDISNFFSDLLQIRDIESYLYFQFNVCSISCNCLHGMPQNSLWVLLYCSHFDRKKISLCMMYVIETLPLNEIVHFRKYLRIQILHKRKYSRLKSPTKNEFFFSFHPLWKLMCTESFSWWSKISLWVSTPSKSWVRIIGIFGIFQTSKMKFLAVKYLRWGSEYTSENGVC